MPKELWVCVAMLVWVYVGLAVYIFSEVRKRYPNTKVNMVLATILCAVWPIGWVAMWVKNRS